MAEVASAPATGTATVIGMCKIPNGLICTLFEKRSVREVTHLGTRETEQYFRTDQTFTLNGPGHPQNAGPRCKVLTGFAMTRGIPKAFAQEWMKQNATLPAVKNGLIFFQDSGNKAEGEAREKRALRTGLERVSPDAIPVVDPRLAAHGIKIEIDKDRSAKPSQSEFDEDDE